MKQLFFFISLLLFSSCSLNKSINKIGKHNMFIDFVFPTYVDSAIFQLLNCYLEDDVSEVNKSFYIHIKNHTDFCNCSDTNWRMISIIKYDYSGEINYDTGVVKIDDQYKYHIQSTNRFAIIGNTYKIPVISEADFMYISFGSRNGDIRTRLMMIDEYSFRLRYVEGYFHSKIQTNWTITNKNNETQLHIYMNGYKDLEINEK